MDMTDVPPFLSKFKPWFLFHLLICHCQTFTWRSRKRLSSHAITSVDHPFSARGFFLCPPIYQYIVGSCPDINNHRSPHTPFCPGSPKIFMHRKSFNPGDTATKLIWKTHLWDGACLAFDNYCYTTPFLCPTSITSIVWLRPDLSLNDDDATALIPLFMYTKYVMVRPHLSCIENFPIYWSC